MNPKVYVIVLNWNKWEYTIECLESVFKLKYDNFQVLMVDNGSTDGSEEKIIQWAEGKLSSKGEYVPYSKDNKPVSYVRYDRAQAEAGGDAGLEAKAMEDLAPGQQHPMVLIQSGANLGYAAGNNVAMRYALARGDLDYVWWLNNDTAAEGGALAALVEMAEEAEGVGAVGSKLLYYDDPSRLQAAGGGTYNPLTGNTVFVGGSAEDDGTWDKQVELGYITGASMLVPKKVVEDVGPMIEEYFLCWEDLNWCLEIKKSGFLLLYCPDSRVFHKEGGTVGRFSPTIDYYWVRNGLKLTLQFHPFLLPSVLAAYILKYTAIRIARRHPLNFKHFLIAIKDFIFGKDGEVY